MLKQQTPLAWVLVGLLSVVGCGRTTTRTVTETSAVPAEPVKLTVSAATSLQDAMKAIQPLYQQEHPNVAIAYNFGSSGSLTQQIEQGAPVDIYLSAAAQWVDTLQEKGLLWEGTRRDLLKNAMVLITPQDKRDIAGFEDLNSNAVSKVAIGDPESVPAGQYAREVLTALDLFDPLQPKFVFAKDVRQVLSYVETANVDAGLVYATDAKVSARVQVAATAPQNSHVPIIYPIAVLSDSKNPEAAAALVAFLASDAARSVFEEYGFSMAGN